MARVNRQLVLAARPAGMIRPTDVRLVETPVPPLGEGEFLVRTVYLSLDPTIRGWMNEQDTYLPAIRIGEVVRSVGLGVVEESRHGAYAPGDVVLGLVGWQEYFVGSARDEAPVMPVPPGIPLTAALSVYGVTGMTAYFGLLDIGRPKPGETLVVSGAAGAVGSVAGQIGRLKGCRVVGIAGAEWKCRWVTEDLGFDACINYRMEDVAGRLRELCPGGVDIFFDNVGGDILDAVLGQLALRARVVLCGAISQYNATELPPGPRNCFQLIIRRARMEGFIVSDYAARFPEAFAEMAGWVAGGQLKYAVDVVGGLEQAPVAINRLFTGEHTGKLLVQVAEEPAR